MCKVRKAIRNISAYAEPRKQIRPLLRVTLSILLHEARQVLLTIDDDVRAINIPSSGTTQ